MSKPVDDVIESAREAIASAVKASMRAITVGIGCRTDDEIKLAFDANPKEAPLWAHAATRIAAGSIKAEQTNPAQTGAGNSLHVVIIEKASRDEWLQMAAPYREVGRQLAAPKEVIETTALPAAEAKK